MGKQRWKFETGFKQQIVHEVGGFEPGKQPGEEDKKK
jgi:hypothetical protein